jgi:hypothetical protein
MFFSRFWCWPAAITAFLVLTLFDPRWPRLKIALAWLPDRVVAGRFQEPRISERIEENVPRELFSIPCIWSHHDLRKVMPMRKIPQALYLSAAEVEDLLKERLEDAEALPDGPERQAILKEIAQLRMYAEAKRWIESPGLKPRE